MNATETENRKVLTSEQQQQYLAQGYDVLVLRDLEQYPTDDNGWTRHVHHEIANLDWHFFGRDEFLRLLDDIRDAAQARWDGSRGVSVPDGPQAVTCVVRIGGAGTNAGPLGNVYMDYFVPGLPQLLV